MGSNDGQNVDIKIVEQDKNHTRLEITLKGYNRETVSYQDGKTGDVISACGMFGFPIAGVPDIPALCRVIQVPEDAVVNYVIVRKTEKIYDNIRIAPCRGGMYSYTTSVVAILYRI